VFDRVKADFQRVYWNYPSKDPANLLKKVWVVVNSQGFQALAVYRLQRWCMEIAKRPKTGFFIGVLEKIASVLQKIILLLYDINISKKADIGKGFCIHHFGGIHIGVCRIGENCTIAQQVKIAPERENGDRVGVTMEDRVWIGGHCIISGKVHIGKGCTISSGSIITKDISPNHLVAGKKGRILNKNFDNTKLHNLPDLQD